MAMTKRTDATRTARQQTAVVVDLFLDVLLSNQGEIPMESRCVIGALVDFKGQIPKSSGFRGFCTLAAKVDRMRDWSDIHLLACMIVRNLSDRQREAVVCDRAYRGRTKVAIDPFMPDKPVEVKLWDDKECARELGCTVPALRQRIVDGYSSIEQALRAHQSQDRKAA
jgi:hypothetical protein